MPQRHAWEETTGRGKGEEICRWKGVFGESDDGKGSDGEKDLDVTEHKRNGVGGPAN